MKKIITIVSMAVAFSFQTSLSFSEQTNYDIGSIAGAEMKIGLGARPVAMGEAFIALSDDLNATAWNPAGLAHVKGGQAGFMHNIYLEDTALEYLAYSQNLFKGAGIGGNVMLLNFGEMEKISVDTNNLPVVEDTFTPIVFVATVGYGQQLMSNLAVGGSLKVYGLNIDTESYTAVAVDLGMQLHLSKSFKTALTVQNLGTAVADSNLPMLAKAGLAYEVPVKATAKDKWNVLLDVNLPFGDVNYTSANVGTEYWYNDVVAVRAGYKIKDTGDLGGITGLTAGAGGKLVMNNLSINLDYAMLSYGDLGITHQIALGVGF